MNNSARSIALALTLAAGMLAGCGEHPCTLHVGEPKWCTAAPEDAAPFCAEVCGVCEAQGSDKWGSACRAQCRAHVGIDDLQCEELDAAVEAAYRACVEELDYPGCGGHR